ncbi:MULTISPECIES: tyrosine--tRNA ligase [unclassified Fusibacter]|uniref:tyrosine--tRNA ligase n=1 Tax=unclassified Fusibacter TaxID=2624464 RepID=UPI0010104DD5|nr:MULTISPECIES: tyrosine--tRNA ligase [unclassified Fusibacter]MCK8058275.1 tyrosine--tRNA ligase [Fusibacter sp. A2]NPE20858.1 tyrosine--tRNA ligase [Fusibacter sp. A1]RXV63062.1 tyrosine--tRNA ligase [Fusibacter sp. A1]
MNSQESFERIALGTAEIIHEEELKKMLESNRQLTIKLGLDPTAPDIHLGHAVVLRKMKHFQELGHKCVIIIGDFTGRIGDPTGKSKMRPALSESEILANAKTYENQIFKILDPDLTEVRFNSEWLSKLNFTEVIELASEFTVARMLERDDFKQRFKHQLPIGIHEFFYPIMQAFDSVAIDADIEIGGTDQRFNLLMGRTLQENKGHQKQVALFMPLLVGLDGIEKMSKSLGNYIGINESAEEIFGKVMSLSDDLMMTFYELATDITPSEKKQIENALLDGTLHPKEAKVSLAKRIIGQYHKEEDALCAQENFNRVFRDRKTPELMTELGIKGCENDLIGLILSQGLMQSKSEIKRMMIGGGIRVNGEKVRADEPPILREGDVLKVGKKHFFRLV